LQSFYEYYGVILQSLYEYHGLFLQRFDKYTFSKRVLSEIPRFVQVRKSISKDENFGKTSEMSTFENDIG
jgi:hypothetical protein